MLIDKGKGIGLTPSAFRPLCILDDAGKLLEKLLRLRLQEAIEAVGDLSDKQYGSRQGRSTIDAIQRVIDIERGATFGNLEKVGVPSNARCQKRC